MGWFGDVDPVEVAARWASPAPPCPRLIHCPPRELDRTPAAARIGALAADVGLFSFHFEHRVHLELPEHHGAAEPPAWSGGVLPERKYQSFRHDLPIGSFHPAHRGKWTAHELCHGLVGFGWSPRATPFFHATAGRLAELLPVALWYWFDEAFLRRCSVHQGGGALFRLFCPACEELQSPAPDLDGAARIADGIAFLEAELDAVTRSRRSGTIVPHRFATLDLSSDGEAYALAHGGRLASAEFATFVERFAVDGGGWSPSLDALTERVVAVARALLSGEASAPLAPSPEAGRLRWIVQDVAWRLLCVQAQTDGDAARGLDAILDQLAQAAALGTGGGVGVAATAYCALHDEFELPDPDDVFALGYPVAGLEPVGAVRQLMDGLSGVCAGSLERAGEPAVALLVARDQEAPRRAHLADRWANALEGNDAALARFEAALAVVPGQVRPTLGGPGAGTWRLAPGVRIERFEVDVIALAEGRPVESADLVLGFASSDGEAVIVGLEPAAATLLEALPGPLALDPAELDALVGLGLITPAALLEEAP